ncbi:MAG: biotin--[acetyl-CoA-carboxylase] ligase [Treponema sp.]|nr:biotin--[acetyl-CoA-carboxylase] ligase [Treponema sp.]
MRTLDLKNPFNLPVYFKETVESTMDEARTLAAAGAGHGTVIAADYQTAGRGRGGRSWRMVRGADLSFTVILRYDRDIPEALTLRAGLALSLAVEDFAPVLRGAARVKWPNDLMLLGQGWDPPGRKAAGILTEASGGAVYLGMGINLARRSFPPELAKKACSIASLAGGGGAESASSPEGAASPSERRFALLGAVLARLHEELEAPAPTRDGPARGVTSWRERLEERLYLKGRMARFVPGPPEEAAPSSLGSPVPPLIEGLVEGIGPGGELRIRPAAGGSVGGEVLSFVTGEFKVYD